MNLEGARNLLKGLGHDAETVAAVMKNVDNVMADTAYSMDQGAKVAANVMAAGIKPGKELEYTLGLIADTATVSGRSLDEIGDIFNKVGSAGKMTGREMNQLHQSGIPILEMLANSTGKSKEEVQKLVSAGKIGFAEFQDALEKGLGGAANAMNDTFESATKKTVRLEG